MIRWIRGLWYRRCRAIDMQILWPICREHGADLNHAKAAFAVHALHDEAWLFLGEDAVIAFINSLE